MARAGVAGNIRNGSFPLFDVLILQCRAFEGHSLDAILVNVIDIAFDFSHVRGSRTRWK